MRNDGPEYAGSTHAWGACRPGSTPGGPNEAKRSEGRERVAFARESKAAAMFGLLAEPRGGVAEISERRRGNYP